MNRHPQSGRSRWATSFVVALVAVSAVALMGAMVIENRMALRPVLARATVAYEPKLGFEQLDLTYGWRFQPDPHRDGVNQGWASIGHDDSSWGELDAVDCWENLGYPNYDGVAWYRREILPPISWAENPVYLWLNGADDEVEVFVNGESVAHYGDFTTQKGAWDEKVPTRIDDHVRFDDRNVVALRVTDWHDTGGLCKQPVVLSTSPDSLFSGYQYIARLAEESPQAVWPAWARRGERAWTVGGIAQGPTTAVVGIDGTASPTPYSFSITYWVYDPATQRLIAPEQLVVEQRLQDGYQPTPITTWRDAWLEGEATVLATDALAAKGMWTQMLQTLGLSSRAPPEPVVLYHVKLTNTGGLARRLVLVAALRPYGPNGALRWLGSVEGASDTVYVNGRLALVADRAPAGFGATSVAGTDLSELLREGAFPSTQRFDDPQGLATIGLEYLVELEPGQAETLTFALPMTNQDGSDDSARVDRLRELRFEEESLRMRAEWQSELQRVSLNLPDSRYTDAFYASLGYLLVNMRGSVVTSGPYAHHAMWYRDAAYVLSALQKAGLGHVTPPVIERLAAGQLASGEFPAALEVDGRPRFHERHEWDALGEFIYTVSETHRLQPDRAALEAAYPAVARAADFIVLLSESTRSQDRAGTPFYGIMPPGDSAEDLGRRDWHHYWDSFWSIGGLREAANIARALGKDDDARRFDREATDLQELVLTSIDLVRQQRGIDYIPNGPEDFVSSSMARGTTPAVWPLRLFDSKDPLIARSFEHYDERWVRPKNDAYIHNSGNLWVYGGLELAHSQLYLGRVNRAADMVEWVLDNQTAPGVYAWAEAVDPSSKRFAGGDMPHSWAAAEYVLYLRDALLREEDNRLLLADGVPAAWLRSGQRVEIHSAPTYFGRAGYSLVSHADEGYWELMIDEGTRAPDGLLLRGPFPSAPTRAVIDGHETPLSGTGEVALPSGARIVRVHF